MALLHDAPEYVIGDMISPFKAALGLDYKAFEAKLEAAIHLRFGLPAHPPAAVKGVIKRADIICAYFEAMQLAGFSEAEAKRFFGAPPRGDRLRLAPQADRRSAGSVPEALPVADRSGVNSAHMTIIVCPLSRAPEMARDTQAVARRELARSGHAVSRARGLR